MATSTGQWVWYELLTTDVAAAEAFYTNVVGWNVSQETMPEMPDFVYHMLKMGDTPVGGIMDLPKEARDMGAPSNWMGYISVDDVDASEKIATAAGGKTLVPPTDIPGVGRFSVLADPHGAVFSLLKSANPDQDMVPDNTAKGNVGWRELYAGDLNAEWAYYSKLFGWQKQDAMDMGDMGVYQLFGIGDVQLGGMMTKPPMIPVSYWGYYFNIGNIDDGAERVKAGGGQVLQGPMEVPGGGWIVQCMDPQGAAFALLGSR
jgi:predicted enzyme related to lactoylglutathione lyase